MEYTKINPVSWFEIYVDDMERAKKFYEAVLQIQLMPLPTPEGMEVEMYAFAMTQGVPGASGALVKMKVEGFGPSNKGTVVYFESEDCATEEARVADAGGHVIKSKEGIGEYGFMTIISDTEGNTIGLHSMK